MPTFVAEYGDTWNSATSPKSASVTVANGDGLVVVAIVEDDSRSLTTPTGGGLTYTLQEEIPVTDYTHLYVWTALSASSQTFTLEVAHASGDNTMWYGFIALRFSSVSSVGAAEKTNVSSGAPSLSITTTSANSSLVIAVGDWNAADGTSRTWRSVNGSAATETTYFRDASHYVAYTGYHPDAGATGAKTVGLSAPSGQKYAIASVELIGGAGGTTCSPTGIASGEAFGTAVVSTSITCSPTGIASAEAFGTPTRTATITCSPSSIATAEAFGTATVSTTIICLATGIGSAEAFGNPTANVSGSSSPTGIPSAEAFGTPTVTTTVTCLAFGIESLEAVGTPTVQYASLRKRLKDLYVAVPHRLAGDAQSYILRDGLTAYGNGAPLSVKRDPSNKDLEGKTYVFRGGYVHETTDPTVIQLWIDSGFEVEDV
jgi:hypothetical protein